MQSPADIVVSAGSSLSSVNLFLSYKNNARNVVLMKPSFLSLDRFDLALIPEHDRIKAKDNVLLTRITPNLIDRQYLQEQADILKNRLRLSTNAPTIGLLIGGDTPKYKITAELINKIISQLKELARNLNCPILATTSRRTPRIVEKSLQENFANFSYCKLLVIANEKNIPEAVGGILGLSDIVLVSGESISMVSEAISAQKYVLVFNLKKRVKASTRQERFLEKLEKEGALKVIAADKVFPEIATLWKEKPYRKKIEDNELIYQALGKLI